jgi:outer membrane protein OmpA-like peptidoglycan-associated protein
MRFVTMVLVLALGALPLAGAAPRATTSLQPRAGLLAELEFDVDSTTLYVGSLEAIRQVAGWALANPDGVIVVEGHADESGTDAYNVQLSLDRANGVRAELLAAQVPADQIIVAAFGERGRVRGDNRRVAMWAMRADADRVAAAVRKLKPALIDTGDGAVAAR